MKHTKKKKTAGFSCWVWTHCTAFTTWMEADCSSTLVQHSRLARHSSVQEQPRDPLLVRHLSERQMEQRSSETERKQSASTSRDKHRRQYPGCRRSPTNHCRQRLDGDSLWRRILQPDFEQVLVLVPNTHPMAVSQAVAAAAFEQLFSFLRDGGRRLPSKYARGSGQHVPRRPVQSCHEVRLDTHGHELHGGHSGQELGKVATWRK